MPGPQPDRSYGGSSSQHAEHRKRGVHAQAGANPAGQRVRDEPARVRQRELGGKQCRTILCMAGLLDQVPGRRQRHRSRPNHKPQQQQRIKIRCQQAYEQTKAQPKTRR